jgi:hypothetical protein
LSSIAWTLILASLLTFAAAPRASELSDFHSSVAQAYGFYRSAMFHLRTGNTMVAGFELSQMREQWEGLRTRYVAKPPDAYADLADFGSLLSSVGERAATAEEAIANGDAEAASEALAPVRGMLAQMRESAGVRVFSDHVDAVTAAMDALYEYRRKRPLDMQDAAQVNDVKAKAAVLHYLVQRCDAAARPEVRGDGEFRRLIDGMLASSADVPSSLDEKNETAVVNLLRELRSFERILYLRFG